jgi:hypothetical protein
MKDKWMNINYENDELRPYEEPSQDFSDNYRIGNVIEQDDRGQNNIEMISSRNDSTRRQLSTRTNSRFAQYT